MFTQPGVVVTGGQTARVNIALTIEVQQEKVVVSDTTAQVDVNPENNANTIVLQGRTWRLYPTIPTSFNPNCRL